MKNTNVSVVKAKREFSELLGRVAVGKETFTINCHGKPMAVLAPTRPAEGLQGLKGWLENDDPFFRDIQHIIGERKKHKAAGFACPNPSCVAARHQHLKRAVKETAKSTSD